jgi:hypothetical protein
MVPDLHSMVQKILAQSGAKFLLTTDVAWQHCAGAQSESTAQVILSIVIGFDFGMFVLITYTKNIKTAIANISPTSGLFIIKT